MKIACYLSDDGAFEQVERCLGRVRLSCQRYPSELALLRGLRRRDADLMIVEVRPDQLDSDGIFSWLGCRSGETVPVLLLARDASPGFRAGVLDAGADAVMTLPFDGAELAARVRALLRRANRSSAQRTIEHAGFVLDREASTLLDRGVAIDLTPREFTMAWLFFSTPGVFIARETISVAIWGVGSEVANRTIEQHVYKLRKKLQLGPARGAILRTAYTQGYRLEISAPAPLPSMARDDEALSLQF